MKNFRYTSIVCSLLSAFLGYQISFAQTYPWDNGTWEQQLSKQIGIPGTFESLSAKKVEIGSTGDFTLDIPLLRIPSRSNLAFDLRASYAPGITVNQEASSIGLGWNIPLGAITRNVLARVDRKPNSIISGDWEGYRDFYTIACPAGSGTMLQFPSGTSGEYVFKLEEMRAWEITYDSNTNRFIVAVEDGTTYVFDFIIVGASTNVYREYGEVGLQAGDQPPGMQWLLTAILSNDYIDGGNDPYNPLDSPQPAINNSGGWIAISYMYDPVGMPNDAKKWFFYQRVPYPPDWVAQNVNLVELSYPWRIVSPTFVAEFITESEERNIISEKMDMTWGSNPHGPYFTPDATDSGSEKKRRLASVSLYPYSGSGTNPVQSKLISKVEFEYLPSGQITPRTMLSEIKIQSETQSLPSYKFEYYGQVGPAPDYDSMQDQSGLLEPSYHGRLGFDGWYNGHPEWHGQTTGAQGLSTDGEAWNLKKIIYPSGGSNEFYYEADRYCNLGDCSPEGSWYWGRGVRLTSQVVNDGSGSTQSYAYSYSSFALNGTEAIGKGVMYNNPLWYFRIFHSSDVPNSNAGFRSAVDNQLSATRTVMYEKVVETNSLIGSIASFYAVRKYDDYWLTFQASTDPQVIYDRTLKNRGYLRQREYRNTSGTLLRKEEFHRAEEILQTYSVSGKPLYMSVVKMKDSVAAFQYDQNGQNPVTTTAQYLYENPDHIQLTKQQETNSDGTQRITEYKYAHEKYPGMNASGTHMISQLYSTTVKKGTSDVEAKKWTVWSNSDGYWRPREEWLWRGDGSVNDLTAPTDYGDSETYKSLTFEAYDSHGNPIRHKDANNTITKSIYGHSASIPIASFQNTGTGPVNADNFNDGSISDNDPFSWSPAVGTWSVTNGALRSTSALSFPVAGNHNQSYQNFTVDVAVRVLNDYGSASKWVGIHFGSTSSDVINSGYIVYYKTGGAVGFDSPSISFPQEVSTGKLPNIWRRLSVIVNGTNVQVFVDGQRYINYNLPSAATSGYVKLCTSSNVDAEFDDFRTYPNGALATTYSYDPSTLLVTSTTDENGATTQYDYDNLQRFARVVSSDNRIVFENSYYYSRAANNDTYTSSDPNFTETSNFPEGISRNGLVGYWRFERNTFDASGNGFTGNLYGDAHTTKRGYAGSTLALDGNGDYVRVPHNTLLVPTSGMTVAAWIYLESDPNYDRIIGKGYWSSGNFGSYIVQLNSGTDRRIYFWTNAATGYSLTSVSHVPLNQWTHIACVYDGSQKRIYVNGILDASASASGTIASSTTDLGIGTTPNESGTPQNVFHGKIDEVLVYNRGLSETEIKSIATPHVMTTYVDGMGREIQTQTRLGNNNIMTAKTYDALGRLHKTYKPYQATLGSNAHRYDQNVQANSSTYYPADLGYTYVENQYLAEPLSRLDKQGNPGDPWKIGSGHEVKYQYTNDAAGQRLKTRVIDESGRSLDKYIDRFGNTVLNVVDPGGALNLETEYEYDITNKVTETTDPNNLSTTYAYNTLQQLREKTSPDAGTVKYLYDKNGNLRLIKDANHTGSVNGVSVSGYFPAPTTDAGSFTMNLPGKLNITMTMPASGCYGSYIQTKIKASNGSVLGTFYSTQTSYTNSIILPKGSYLYEVTTDLYCSGEYPTYSLTANQGYELVYQKYGALNRLIELGEYESTSISSHTQANADNISFPTSNIIVAKKFFYDNPSSNPAAVGQRNLRGRLSVAESYRSGTLILTTFYSYDGFGRVSWIRHVGMGSDKLITYDYDLRGNTTRKGFQDMGNNANNLYTFYEYDQMGRLLKVLTNQTGDNANKVKEAEYTYNAASLVTQLKLGSSNIQTVDYTYNSRNWLTSINNVDNIGSDRFAGSLHYNDNWLSSPALYNGDISALRFYNAGVSSNQYLGYRFSYDPASRLTGGQTYLKSGSNWVTTDYYRLLQVIYDANSNITTLTRLSQSGFGMDNLTYTYSANRVTSIYNAYGGATQTYTYDANGNAISDSYRKINYMTYDIRNLPLTMYHDDGTISYWYDANGNRVRKQQGTLDQYYFVGADGQTEAVYNSNGTLRFWNITANGQLIGKAVR